MEVQVSSHDANVDEDYIGSATSPEALDAPSRMAVDDYPEGEESQRDLQPMPGDHGGAGVSVPDQSPPPAESANVPYSQSAPPNPTPNQTAFDPAMLKAYRRLHNLMLAPNIPPMQRAKFMQAGFRVDESGALIGAAGLVFDSKGQPGIGATVPPKMHTQAWVRMGAAAMGAFTRDGLPPNGSGSSITTGAPAESSNAPYSQSAPPNPTPNQTPVDPAILKAYRRMHKLMLAPNIPPTYRDNFMQAGFRVDESGALIGVAGLILDSKRQPGIGATVPPRTHAQAWMRLDEVERGAFARGELPVGPRPTENPPDECGPTTTTGAPAQNLGNPSNPRTGTPSGSPNVWRGQIAYLFQRRIDQEPATLHFPMIAVGAPNQNIETHRWPTRLTATTGFRPLPQRMATQLYNSPIAIPFGQIKIDQPHTDRDIQKWQVFQKIITAGWCIFYEFPHNSGNPPHDAAQGSHGVLFFSTAQAPGRILFKVFTNRLYPSAFTRGGKPAGPGLSRNPNPALMQGPASSSGIAGMPAGAPGLGSAGMPGPNPATVPSLNPGAALNINPAGVPGRNATVAIQAAIYRSLGRMAFARIGITPAQLAAMPPAQRQPILQQVRQMVLRMRSQQQQNMAAAGMAGA